MFFRIENFSFALGSFISISVVLITGWLPILFEMTFVEIILNISFSLTAIFLALGLFFFKNSKHDRKRFAGLTVSFLMLGLVFAGFYSFNVENKDKYIIGPEVDSIIIISSIVTWFVLLAILFIMIIQAIYTNSDYVLDATYLEADGKLHINSHQIYFDSEYIKLGMKRDEIYSVNYDDENHLIFKHRILPSINVSSISFVVVNPKKHVKEILDIID